MNLTKLTYDQLSELRGRVFAKSLRGTYEHQDRADRIYDRLKANMCVVSIRNTLGGQHEFR